MVRFRVLPSVVLAACLAAAPQAFAGPRAVLELFTSQGCSSCPAADRLIGEIAGDRSLVVLTLPIDYWDYLGWKDTLALKGHTHRQRAYAKSRGDREVYTPQVVVNGTAHVLGNDHPAIERALASAPPLRLPVSVSVTGDKVVVQVPAASDDKAQGEVWLCPTTRTVNVEIGRGENKGRTITYTNVVRRWVKLGEWSGRPETFTVPVATLAGGDVDAVTVLVQGRAGESPRPMLGAAQAGLR